MGCALSIFWKKKPAPKTDDRPHLYIPLPRREPVPEFPTLTTFYEHPGTVLYEEDNWRPYYEGRAAPPIGYSGVGRTPSMKGRKDGKGKGKERDGGEASTSSNTWEFDQNAESTGGGSGGGGGGVDKKKRKGAPRNMEVIVEDDNE